MLLDNKVIIITGAAGGIGEGIARVCHREGANVVIADVRAEVAAKVAADLGGNCLAAGCDLRSDDELTNLVEAAVRRFGRLDGLVNNAGVNFAKPFLETTAADWEDVISVDLRAVFFLSQLAVRQMLEQKPAGGSIVNISSVHSVAGVPGAVPYDAAKAGVVGMSRSMAVELAPRNIRINVVSPGLINTQMWKDMQASVQDVEAYENYWKANIPMGRVIEPSEIGELTAFLLSDRASCMTGTNICADAGMTSQLVSRES